MACVPLFAALMTYEVYYGLLEEEGALPAEHQVRWGEAKPVTDWGPGLPGLRKPLTNLWLHPSGVGSLMAAS